MARGRDVRVKIGADTSSLGPDLNQMVAAFQSAGRRLSQVGQSMSKVGKTMSVALTAPLTAFGALALKAAGDFESSMNRVGALSGAAGSEFNSLREQAKQLGRDTQYSASQAADAMGFLAMAGFEANEILSAMPSTLQLAAAAQMDLATAADITSNILTGYGLEVAELGRANDVLVKAFTSANTDLAQLGDAMKYVGPIARSAGVSFEEVAAALGMLGNAGIQGSMAGTTLRGAISRLLNPSAEAARVMARLGLSVTDAAGRLLPLADIVEQLEPHAEDTAAMLEIFGDRAGPGMATLVGQGSAAVRELTAELEISAGTAQRIAEAQMKGMRGAILELKSAFEGLQIAMTEGGALDAITGLIRRLAGVTRGLSDVSDETFRTAIAIGVAVAAIGPLVLAIGMLTTGLGALAIVTGTALLPLIAIGGPIVLGVTAIAAAFVKLKLDAAAAGEEARKAVEAYRESFGTMDKDALLKEREALSAQRKKIQEEIDRYARSRDSHERAGNTRQADRYSRMIEEANTRLEKVKDAGLAVVGRLNEINRAALGAGNAIETNLTDPLETAAEAAERLKKAMDELDRRSGFKGRSDLLRSPELSGVPSGTRHDQLLARGAEIQAQSLPGLRTEAVTARGERGQMPEPEVASRFAPLFEAFGSLIGPISAVAGAFLVLKPIFDGFAEVIGPVLTAVTTPLKVMGSVLGTLIVPVLRVLFPPLKYFGIAVAWTAEQISRAIGSLLRFIGKIPGLGAVKRFGESLIESADAIREQRKELERMSFADAMEGATDAAERFASALSNVPNVLPLALLRFQAGGGYTGGPGGAGGGQGSGLNYRDPVPAATDPTRGSGPPRREPVSTTVVERVEITVPDGVADPRQFAREVYEEIGNIADNIAARGGTSRLAVSLGRS